MSISDTPQIRIGLYGANGHQLSAELEGRARVAAAAQVPPERLRPGIRVYPELDDLIADPEIDLISLCSPRRIEQEEHAIRCLRGGKHVLAEKPCAFDAGGLDRILAAAQEAGRAFREMAASELNPPLQAIRRLVERGALGEIVHVQAHKSYPWHDRRPQETAVDGGLVRQVGIHAVRFIHGATGLRIRTVEGRSTGLGNPGGGEIQIAAAFALELDGGAVGSINLNYLNPPNFGVWGNDQLRVFGTEGMAETVDGFRRHSLYLPGREGTDLPFPDDLVTPVYVVHYANFLLDGAPMPTPFGEEMAMTRAALALHRAAETGRRVTVAYPDR